MLEITFVSDYVCPYCLVGKEALRQALGETGIQAEITFQPIEMTMEPEPRVDTYHDSVRRERYERILTKDCLRKLGLENMKIPPHVIPRPYTRLAYEGWLFATEHGKGEAFNDLMYRSYFIDEKDIGDVGVLIELAEGLGLPGDQFKKALEEGRYTKRERELIQYAKEELKVKTIPTLIINGHVKYFGKYSKEEAIGILTDEAGLNHSGFGCGADGC